MPRQSLPHPLPPSQRYSMLYRPVRSGFTLFEVALSLVIVTFAVVSILVLMPQGLKAQQMARFQIYAAAKAEEMIEQFNNCADSNPAIDSEGLTMWDQPVAHKGQSWDLECRLSAHRFGLMPVPPDITRRIDSDNDEIKHILDLGGQVYYSQPLASTGTQEQGQLAGANQTIAAGTAAPPPNEAQRVIIGVVGFAQQNSLTSFPMKNWPYHTPWPSPPLHMSHMADLFLPKRVFTSGGNPDSTDPETNYFSYYVWPFKDMIRNDNVNSAGLPNDRNWVETFCFPWETAPQNRPHDPDIQKVMDWPEDSSGIHVGYFPYACGRCWEWGGFNGDPKQFYPTKFTTADYHMTSARPPSYGADYTIEGSYATKPTDLGDYPSRPGVLRYVASTLWYFDRKKQKSGISSYIADAMTVRTNPYEKSNVPSDKRWMEVQAYRFLAHATACLTSWYSYTKSGGDTEDLSGGVTIPTITIQGITSPAAVITHSMIKYIHERSLYLINDFAASYPYDWAMPRPLNRVMMMDFPLLQADLFTQTLPGGLPPNQLYGPTDASCYDYVFGRGPSNTGAINYRNAAPSPDKPKQWRVVSPMPIRNIGTGAIFPTNIINPTMRAGSYEPTSHFGNIDHYNLAAPFEAAERCRELVFWAVDWQSYEDYETAPSAPIDASKYPIGSPRCNWHDNNHNVPTPRTRSYHERLIDLEFRDEQLWSYRNPEKTILFFQDPSSRATGAPVEDIMVLNRPWTYYPDQGPSLNARKTFAGIYGADRNYNKKLDRGNVPKSVRLRAQQVARFNYYDPRVQAIMR